MSIIQVVICTASPFFALEVTSQLASAQILLALDSRCLELNSMLWPSKLCLARWGVGILPWSVLFPLGSTSSIRAGKRKGDQGYLQIFSVNKANYTHTNYLSVNNQSHYNGENLLSLRALWSASAHRLPVNAENCTGSWLRWVQFGGNENGAGYIGSWMPWYDNTVVKILTAMRQ